MKPEAVLPALRARGLFPEIMARLRIKRQAVEAWRVVPADRVIVIAQLSGLEPHIIRPDIFPDAGGNTRPLEGFRTLAAQRARDATLRQRRTNRSKQNGKATKRRIERSNPGSDQGRV